MVTTSKSMHREVEIKHDLMTCKCKYTHRWPKIQNERFVWENKQYLYSFYLLPQPSPSDLWLQEVKRYKYFKQYKYQTLISKWTIPLRFNIYWAVHVWFCPDLYGVLLLNMSVMFDEDAVLHLKELDLKMNSDMISWFQTFVFCMIE